MRSFSKLLWTFVCIIAESEWTCSIYATATAAIQQNKSPCHAAGSITTASIGTLCMLSRRVADVHYAACPSVSPSLSVRPSARPSHDGQLDAANLFMDDGPICLLARPTTGLLSNAARRVAHGGREGRDRLPARAS